MPRKTLLVGPNGYLASHLLSILKETDGIVPIGLGVLDEPAPGVAEYFTDVVRLKQAHPEFGTIYLLGSYIPYGSYHVPSPEFVRSNIQLVAQLSMLYPEARIVFSSSVSVYGQPLQLPLDTHSPFNNPDLYGMSKLAGEAIVRNHKSHGILRFTSIIGPGMRVQTMVPKMIAAAKAGTITVWGDGSRCQNYVDVRDAAAMCRAVANSQENYIALGAGPGDHTNLEVAQLLASITGAKVEFTGEDNAPSFAYDTAESYRLLNFSPRFPLERTLRDMIGH